MTNPRPQLSRIVYDIEKILDRIPHDVKHKGGFYIDHYMEECLETVDRVNELQNVTIRQKLKAKKRIFEVYFKLQKYKGPHIAYHNDHRVIYTGGLGYASVSKAMMTERMGKTVNHYWKPRAASDVTFKTERPSPTSAWSYKGKETMEEWRDKMAAEKKAILNELL